MIPTQLSRCGVLLTVLAMGACASPKSAGVLAGRQPAHVATVEIGPVGPEISTEFTGQLHGAVIKAAALYGNAGQPITIKIALDKVHYKNPLKAMVIGDNNLARGRASVVDQTSGQQLGTFAVEVDAERPSAAGAGGGIALFLLEAVDPTGAVGLAHMAANAGSAATNRGGAMAGLCANFAAETLRQAFGDATTKAAKIAKRN